MTFIDDYRERWFTYLEVATACQIAGIFPIEDNAEALLSPVGPLAVEIFCLFYRST